MGKTDTEQKSFVVYENWAVMLTEMPVDAAGELIQAICSKKLHKDYEIQNQIVRAVFTSMIPTLETSRAKVTGGRRNERLTAEYRQFRNGVLKRDKYTCQICGCKPKVPNVHHIKSFKDYPALRVDVSNGITLCPECHRKVHKQYGR